MASDQDNAGGQLVVRTTKVDLTDNELVLLDGRCSEKVQTAVDQAGTRIGFANLLGHLTPMQAGFVADVVNEATEKGRLVWDNKRVTYCPLHKDSAGYVPYKSGPNRGRPNYKKPKGYPGVDLAHRFVSVVGHVSLGGCRDCIDPILPDIIEALRGVPAEVPDKLRAEGEPVRKRQGHRHCTACDWRGHEGEMGKLRTLFGDGWYPGKCPSCGAENQPLGRSIIESVDGFTVTEESSAAASHRAGQVDDA